MTRIFKTESEAKAAANEMLVTENRLFNTFPTHGGYVIVEQYNPYPMTMRGMADTGCAIAGH